MRQRTADSAAGGIAEIGGLRQQAGAEGGSLAVGESQRGDARRGDLMCEILARRVRLMK